jgi:hypothetical protein
MRTRRRSITGMVFVALLAAAPAFADPALVKEPTEIVPPRELAERVAIRDLTVAADGTVSGTVCNISKEPVRDVRLLVDRSWLWAKEFHPGTDDPGRAEFHTSEQTIPPGGQVHFTYRPSAPLPHRTDGRFETSVSVVSLVAIEPSTETAR